MKRCLLLVCASLLAVLTVAVVAQDRNDSAGPAPAQTGNSFAVRDVRVFDGAGMIGRATVVVRDGRIAAVGSDVEIPADMAVVDGAGRTLLPGLIDAHAHSWGEARADALRFGVTTELDMLGDRTRLPAIRAQRQSLERTSEADLWSSGAAVTAPGGHGTQYGMQVPTLAPEDSAAAFVDARTKEGADYIKIIVEDFGAYSDSRRIPTLAPAQVEAAIQAAHARERMAVVHATQHAAADHAIRAGADGLVHLFIDQAIDAELVQAISERQAFVIPTLSVLLAFAGGEDGAQLVADRRLQPWLNPAQVASLKGRMPAGPQGAALRPQLLATVQALHAAGVPILAGTDAGNPGTTHGASMHGELALLVAAGLTPVEALAAATSATADAFGLSDRGRIAPGLRADLLLVQGDPGTDIEATRAIVSVWKNGYALEREVQAAAARAEAAADESLVSDFDGDAIQPRFGAWHGTTDAMAGGTSVASHALVAPGAGGSGGALRVQGETREGFPYPWAGVMFFPDPNAALAFDYSGRTELVFQVRGDGRQYNAMLFSGASMQGIPSVQTFTAGSEWTLVRLRLDAFAGGDPAQLRAIAFTAGEPLGSFEFFLDQVQLR